VGGKVPEVCVEAIFGGVAVLSGDADVAGVVEHTGGGIGGAAEGGEFESGGGGVAAGERADFGKEGDEPEQGGEREEEEGEA